MTVTITLTLAGSDTGPFNIYSNADGYTTAIVTGVDRNTLTSGYNITTPDGTTEVLVRSTGVCHRDLYLNVVGAPTTTTTTSSTTSTTSTTTTLVLGYYYNLQQIQFNCSGGIGHCTGIIGGNLIGYSTVVLVVGDFYNSSGDVYVITGTTTPQTYDKDISSWYLSNYPDCGDAAQC
jgi:hypothetical protein